MKGNMYKYVAVGCNFEVISDKFDFSIISRMLNNSNYFCTKVLVYNYYENKIVEYTKQTTYELKELGDIDKTK